MNYIYHDINTNQYDEIADYEDRSEPTVSSYPNATFLPAIADSVLPWGRGGALDECGNFIEESRLDDSFGEPYAVDASSVEDVDDTVIYLGILPRHWGHVLIDVLSKLWFVVEHPHEYKIAYCGLGWADDGVSGNYRQLLSLADIDDSDLLYVTKPTRFREILIPSRTLGFERPWNKRYLTVVDKIVSNAEHEATLRGLRPFDRIYFTRQNFPAAQKREVGEDQIVDLFRNNGYEIVSPEKLDAVEQVYLYSHCSKYVCLSGTLAHNAVFAQDGVDLTILNRTWSLNPPQIRINQLKGIDATYVDVYDRSELKRASGYRANDNDVHVLSVNDNLEQWCRNCGLSIEHKRHSHAAELGKYWWLTTRQRLGAVKRRVLKG